MTSKRLIVLSSVIAALTCLAAPAGAYAASGSPAPPTELSGTTVNHTAVTLVWAGQDTVTDGAWSQQPGRVPVGSVGGWKAVGGAGLSVRGIYAFGGTGYAVRFSAAVDPGQNNCQVIGPGGKPSDKYWCASTLDLDKRPQLIVG
ncbi:hypothetical protein ACFXPI_11335 [Streptomyces sp. NPDC059104]|uniref:hypothetical protein n=1 Tax=Streptomyces sp. NPDC059104 TaxID=3346729 RepID=UPI0036813B6B